MASRVDAPMPNLAMLSTRGWGFLRDDPAEPVTQTGSRQAEGVTQEGSSTRRWLSWSKGVGRYVGKSACHEPET
jgi:hypothetical protein